MAIDKAKWEAMRGKNAFVNWRKVEKPEQPATFYPHHMDKFGGFARLKFIEVGPAGATVECIDGYPRELVGRRRHVDRISLKIWGAAWGDMIQIKVGTEVVIRSSRHRVYPNIVTADIREWKHV